MPTKSSIIIVDDAKFSAAIVRKRLSEHGFTDIRVAHHANDAFSLIAERPANLVISDWIMPDIDGIALCEQIKADNLSRSTFTYCLLMTGKDDEESVQQALSKGLDDFIFKSEINHQLIPRVRSGLRIARQLSNALERQKSLSAEIVLLQEKPSIDPLLGLANRQYAEQTLDRLYRHTQARGGAVSYMSITIKNWGSILSEYKAPVCQELSEQIAKRVNALVRPLDEVCRYSENEFIVLAHFRDPNDCNLSTYRRFYQGLDKQAFKTSAGFIAISISCAVCFADQDSTTATLSEMNAFNAQKISECKEEKTYVVNAL
ncbi:MAG: response regulator [Oleiphilaceae bacterium]|nr:response regulator [Oleiphilaceae bacterium]